MLVVGFGGVGRAVARRFEPFEVEVVPVASTARQTPAGTVHGIDELDRLLPSADVVVLCVPLDDRTRGLVDAALPGRDEGRRAPGQRVPRSGRGDATRSWPSFAAGGCPRRWTSPTPSRCRAGHPLWDVPGLLLSPHVGGNTSAFQPRAERFVVDQLRRFAAGEPLAGVVAGP